MFSSGRRIGAFVVGISGVAILGYDGERAGSVAAAAYDSQTNQEKPLRPDPGEIERQGLSPDDVQGPVPLRRDPLKYPKSALREGLEGEVTLDCVVQTSGKVTGCTVLSGLSPSLDKAAIKGVQKWRFKPARIKGEVKAVYLTISVNFTIKK